jgi:sulfur carrier protein
VRVCEARRMKTKIDREIEVQVNGKKCCVHTRLLRGLMQELGHDPERPGVALAVNDEVVPRARWATWKIHTGDRIEIVGAVQGG